jgi:dinuclear metal center YbgI/SA1388 family protein
MASLSQIVKYGDKYLRVRKIEDWPNALNGLQIENSGNITKIGAAVDVSTRVLTAAAKQHVDLLIVHHGLFWPGLQPIAGGLRRQLKIAFENDIALYSAHLPLDVHPEVGNNAQLAAALGFKSTKPFLEEKGELVGLRVKDALPRAEVIRKLRRVLRGPIKAFNFGPRETTRIGIATGGAGSEIYRGSTPLGGGGGRRARTQPSPRRSLRDRNLWRQSDGRASFQAVQRSMGISRFSNRFVNSVTARLSRT